MTDSVQAAGEGRSAGAPDSRRGTRSPYPWAAHLWDDPPRSRDGILLATALVQLCGGNWGMSGEEVAIAGSRPNEDPMGADRLEWAVNIVGRLLFEGRVAAWARPVGGGEPVPLATCVWELDDFRCRMATSAIDPIRPFDPDAVPTHWVFLSEPDWEAALARLWAAPELTTGLEVETAAMVRVQIGPAQVASRPTPRDEMDAGRARSEERLIRLPEVLDRTGLSRPTLYRRVKSGEFPRGRSLGGKAMAWLESEVDAWIACRS